MGSSPPWGELWPIAKDGSVHFEIAFTVRRASLGNFAGVIARDVLAILVDN
jgi:hypothetical protein